MDKKMTPCGLGWAYCNGACEECSYINTVTTASTDYNSITIEDIIKTIEEIDKIKCSPHDTDITIFENLKNRYTISLS